MPEAPIPIEVGSSDRAFFTGQTGTGKTFLARHLIEGLDRVVVLDTKGRLEPWRLDPWDRESERLLRRGDPLRTRVPPPAAHSSREWTEYWDAILELIFRTGNVTVYVDEVYLLKREGEGYPEFLSNLYTQGRELGIGTWASAQRPAWVPRVLLSESEHVFAFFLLLEDDRQAMARNLGPRMGEEIPAQDPHGFRYWSLKERNPVYIPQYNPGGPGAGWGELGDLVDEEKLTEEEA